MTFFVANVTAARWRLKFWLNIWRCIHRYRRGFGWLATIRAQMAGAATIATFSYRRRKAGTASEWKWQWVSLCFLCISVVAPELIGQFQG